jgi:hypothetical protein
MNMHILQGTTEDWGLPPARLQALDAELADHAACLVERGGGADAEELRVSVNTRRGRRRLAGAHLAEQVATTLARWPTRREWRELTWLLAWFAVILVSDLVALYAVHVNETTGYRNWGASEQLATPAVAAWVTATWLLQALARAGFFTSFTVSLVHAWRTGWGVLLARVLQLKLIHTVLVVLAMWILSIWVGNYFAYYYIRANWPEWLTAPYLLVYGLALALALLVVSKRRWWPWALGATLLTLFLYPAAPVHHDVYKTSLPISYKALRDEKGEFIRIVPDDDPVRIAKRAEDIMGFGYDPQDLDVEHNIRYFDREYSMPVFGTVQGVAVEYGIRSDCCKSDPRYYEKKSGVRYDLPLFSPNAALAWLAAPIPILGLVGLLGLLVLMGRRSLQDMMVYACLVFIALASTFLPFFFNGSGSIINFTPYGVVSGPLPGFDSLLFGSQLGEVWTIILGLLLSAGIPWLLVALFLKPKPPQLPDDMQVAE